MLIPYIRSKYLFSLAERLSGRMVTARADILRAEINEPWTQRQLKNRFKLVEVLQNAQYEIPYYRDLFRKVGFEPLKVLKDEHYIEQLPVLTKEDLREAGDRIIHSKCKQYLPIHISRTNGSTGSALPIFYTPTSKDYSAAITGISQEWVGFGSDKLQLHISSAFPDGTPKLALRQEWWRQQATNRIGVECDDWTNQSLKLLWSKIVNSKAYLVQGHPSTMYALARYIKNSIGIQPEAFRVFVSTGETLTNQQRELIEEVFACMVANRYGNAEFGIIAHERFTSLNIHSPVTEASALVTPIEARNRKYMQVMDPYVWVESLSSAQSGRSSILVTDLTNFSSPLIRYATGDEGEVIKGSEGVYLTPVAGRIHDQISINGKLYPTHWFQDIFTRLGNVDDFQFVQAENKPLELRICLVDQTGEQSMRSKLTEWFIAGSFNLVFVKRQDFIRVGTQQKFRYLVELDQKKAELTQKESEKHLFEGKHRNEPFIYLAGWNPLEVYGEISFRWMCNNATIAINPEIRAESLTIGYDYPSDAPSFPSLLVTCADAKLYQEIIKPGHNYLSIALLKGDEVSKTINMAVTSLYVVPGDTRQLGLKVHSVCLDGTTK